MNTAHGCLMHEYTIAVPDFQGDGEADLSDFHAGRMRRALLEAGFTGWTEYRHVGYWRGVAEAGTTFQILTTNPTAQLPSLARWAMPGEEAIQIVVNPNRVEVVEA